MHILKKLFFGIALLSNTLMHGECGGGISITPTMITSAPNGSYCIEATDLGAKYTLSKNVAAATVSPGTAVICINRSDITLDLGGNTIDASGVTSGIPTILINGQKNITIQNGNIRGSQGTAIEFATGCENIRIYNMTIQDTANEDAILVTAGNAFTFNNIHIIGVTDGHAINVSGTVEDLVIEDFKINSVDEAAKTGISLAAGCYGVKIKNGRITDIKGDASSDGIYCAGVCYNMLLSDLTIANVTGQGIDLNASYNVTMSNISASTVSGGSGIEIAAGYNIQMSNIYLSNITGGHGINVSGAGYDIDIDSFKISNLLTANPGNGINLASATDRISITNGNISNLAGTVGNGIALLGAHQGITIKNVEIANTTSDGINVVTSVDDAVIENVKVTNAAGQGIDLDAATGVTLKDIYISDIEGGHAIDIDAGQAINIDGFNISNIHTASTGHGINFGTGTDNISIKNGIISGLTGTTGHGIALVASQGIVVKNVEIVNTTKDGINVATSVDDITLENVKIASAAGQGIDLAQAKGATLTNISISDVSAGHGIDINAGEAISIDEFNISTIVGAPGHGINFGTGVDSISIKNGIISGLSGGVNHGIAFVAHQGVAINNVKIANITSDGINVTTSVDDITIEDVKIASAAGDGIDLTLAKGVNLTNIDISAITGGHGITINTGEGIRLNKFNISNINTAASKNGINIGAGVDRVLIDTGTISGVSGTEGIGILITGTNQGVNIKNVELANTNSDCIWAPLVNNLVIENVDCANSGRDGINIGSAPADGSKGISITNFNIGAAVRDGIRLAGVNENIVIDKVNMASVVNGVNIPHASVGINVSNLKVSNPTADGVVVAAAAQGLTFKNLTIASAAGNGVNFSGAANDITIDTFSIADPTTMGIDLSGGSNNVRIRNGSITASTTSINVANSAEDYVIENVDISTSSANGIALGTTVHNALIKNCTIATSSTDGIDVGNNSYGITIQGCAISNSSTQGINFGTAVHNIMVKDSTISTAADGIDVGNNSYGITIKGCNISNATSDGIVFGTTCYGINIEDFNIVNPATYGITFGTTAHGVVIKNGKISSDSETEIGINLATSSYGITIDNVAIDGGGNGILATGASGTEITGLKVSNCTISNPKAADAYGIKCINNINIIISDSNISRCFDVAAESDVVGVFFNTCTNVRCVNVESGGHSGDQAYGFNLTSVNGGFFENCTSQGNFAQSEDGITEGAMGFYMSSSNGCLFKNCKSSGHQSTLIAHGWYLTACSGNDFYNCKAFRNNITNSANGVLNATCTGFYSIGGIGNNWNKCEANGHIVNSSTIASTDGYGAAGFLLSNEQQSTLSECIARGNGLTVDHLANATGIFLDGTIGTDCKHCQVRDCQASSNCTSQVSGTTAYGIRDTADNTKNLIANCFAFGNSDGSSVNTNYYMDLAVGSVTPANWPRVETNMDSLIDLANTPDYYNVSITS
jgi:hypothetical protein